MTSHSSSPASSALLISASVRVPACPFCSRSSSVTRTASHCLRCGGQSVESEGFSPDKLVCPAKRRPCEIVCAYEVAVAARDGAIARVELITHFEGSRNPYIIWKNGVHRSS